MAKPGHRQHAEYCSHLRLFAGVRASRDTFAHFAKRVTIARNPHPSLLPGPSCMNPMRHSVSARASAGNSTPRNPTPKQ